MKFGKAEIISRFTQHIKHKPISLSSYQSSHDGKEGHWLEKGMGVSHNSKTEPDLLGYEMKKESRKISFGDFSACYYLFKSGKINKDQFLSYFGESNPSKNGRYSWSGKCFPTYGKWNDCGQTIVLENGDICIYYLYERDKRERKCHFPEFIKNINNTENKGILLAKWSHEKLKEKIEKKFNQKGFFICKKSKDKGKDKTYNKICFGKPFSYDFFISSFQTNQIFIDSGMYQGNRRNYSHFRSSQSFWNTLINEEY